MTGSDPKLFVDDVDVRDELRHTVLDLEPGVDLEEPEVAVRCQQELGRRRVFQPDSASHGYPKTVKRPTQVHRQPGRWCLLDDLLMAALYRAVTFAERNDVAVVIAEKLDLDVARALDVVLEVDRAIAE